MKEQIRCVPLRNPLRAALRYAGRVRPRKEKEINAKVTKEFGKVRKARHFRHAFTVGYNTSSKFLGSLRRDNAETAAQGVHAPHGSKLCRYYSGRARSGALP